MGYIKKPYKVRTKNIEKVKLYLKKQVKSQSKDD